MRTGIKALEIEKGNKFLLRTHDGTKECSGGHKLGSVQPVGDRSYSIACQPPYGAAFSAHSGKRDSLSETVPLGKQSGGRRSLNVII